MIYPKKLEDLIESFKKLPTIGEKSAERLALATLEMSTEDVDNFSNSLIKAKELVKCKIVLEDNKEVEMYLKMIKSNKR